MTSRVEYLAAGAWKIAHVYTVVKLNDRHPVCFQGNRVHVSGLHLEIPLGRKYMALQEACYRVPSPGLLQLFLSLCELLSSTWMTQFELSEMQRPLW